MQFVRNSRLINFLIAFFLQRLVVILLNVFVKLSSCNEALARSLDLSWRPLSHSPYQQQYFHNNPPGGLISYAHFEAANKEEIVEAAKHNAKLLKAHQPITSYSDPYQMYSQTPGPSSNLLTTASFLNPNLNRHHHQHLVAAGSSHVITRVPPGKTVPLYQTKLNFLGKPDSNAIYQQNSIHQSLGTTPKVAGYTKEHGRVNFHYHHPSFVGNQMSTTTRRIPTFSSSVTPQHYATKVHPVMNKLQAHMALAASSQGAHHKLKHPHSFGFSPPSQIISNYANFGPATSNPFWHSGLTKNNGPFHLNHDTRDFYQHFHKLPEQQHHHSQQQQQNSNQQQQHKNNQQQNHHKQNHNQHQQPNQPPQQQQSVHPSVLTPFLDQVHIKQKEASAAEQKNAFKQSNEANSQENNGSFEIINDVFSKHLVPPPQNPSPTTFKAKPDHTEKKEKKNKYNLSMQSPLQDASRFNYNNVISTATPTTPNDNFRFKPSASDNSYQSTDKPNVFIHLNNRTKENVYKQHKLLHPSYTGNGGLRKKPFLPTPYKPEKEEEIKINYEPQHSFFTIEDAVTPNLLTYQVIKSQIPVEEEPELVVTRAPYRRPEYDYSTQTLLKPTTTVAPTDEQPSSPKPRQKLRRRKQRPQNQMQQQQHQQQQQQHVVKESDEFKETLRDNVRENVKENVREHTTAKPFVSRGSVKAVEKQTDAVDLKKRNRVNHPSRQRNRVSLTSPAAILSTVEYEPTIKASTEEERVDEITVAQHVTTEHTLSPKLEESSEQPENVKRRVRLRYKNKLRTSSNILEAADFKPKLNDNQISDSEHENFIVKQSEKQSDETTELNFSTENGFTETRSSLKLRNEALTTLPTTADTISTSSVQPSSTTVGEQEELIPNKILNRPRFSIKEYKRKQVPTSPNQSTSLTNASAASSTAKPDSNRFNRIRLNINNRRRNETTESGEETEVPRRKYSSSRSSTTTTEAPVQTSSSPKRGTLPKRTFSPRNFTKPAFNAIENETTTSLKPLIKNATTFGTNRLTTPNLRSRIQSFKKKDALNEVVDSSSPEQIKNINLSSETTVSEQSTTTTTSTESPKHETSIMKIAKTPSSVNVEKSTTSDFIDNTSEIVETSETSRQDFDLTGSESQRVAELTISGNDFKSANIGPLSRRIPNYFTISTDDPILPIQAFFPQIKTNENK